MALALGRPPEQLVGLCVTDSALGIWDAAMFLDAFVRTVETGESLNVEVHSTAGPVWFHNIAAKLGDGLVVWFTETTQAKNAEAQQSRIFLHVMMAFAVKAGTRVGEAPRFGQAPIDLGSDIRIPSLVAHLPAVYTRRLRGG